MKSMKCRVQRFEQLEDRRCCAVASVGWDGPGKGSAELTYYIANTPSGLSKATVESAIKTALNAWSNVADIKFTQTSTPGLARSLDFSFGSIDGSGGTLAQAYFPADVNSSRLAGDVKFDSSEKWEIGNALGSAAFDLVRVAVHEIGHALGLDHSEDNSAILAPTVSASESFTKLDADDVDAILALYAPAKASGTTTPTSTTPTNTTPTSTTPTTTSTSNNNPITPVSPTTYSFGNSFRYRYFGNSGFSNFFNSGSFWNSFNRLFNSSRPTATSSVSRLSFPTFVTSATNITNTTGSDSDDADASGSDDSDTDTNDRSTCHRTSTTSVQTNVAPSSAVQSVFGQIGRGRFRFRG